MSEIPTGSECFRRLNPHLFKNIAQPVTADIKRIRQDSKPLLNKLEQDWVNVLKVLNPRFRLILQGIRFKLGNGIWYKPDVVNLETLQAWEVKGPHAFRGGFENLKVAAHEYPDFTFHLVWKEDGKWKTQLVLP